jgi:hypothetical protein
MDSSTAFRIPPRVSADTMSHANLVMSCQWGWSSTQDPNALSPPVATSASRSTANSTLNNVRSKRFAPCQGRLYHQLTCAHRVRTDVVEDCGANCLEPLGAACGLPFLCGECFQAEAIQIWEDRQAQHNANYPSMDQMTKELYDQWYEEHRQLEAEYARDRKAYESEMKSKTRPSNICSAVEVSKEESDFAMELDSLSLSLAATSNTTTNHARYEQAGRVRTALPTDASEQLHWNLNGLALDRGSCGVEYTGFPSPSNVPAMRHISEEEVWSRPRG